MKADLVWWEADLRNGQRRREADGLKYDSCLSRAEWTSFRLTYQGETIFEMPVQDGHDVRYRRQVTVTQGDVPLGTGGVARNHATLFKVGYVNGPAYCIDPEKLDTDEDGFWVAQYWHSGGGESVCSACRQKHPAAAFDPIVAYETERP